MSKDRIFLRPHHSLCLRYFSGKGYSNGFVDNMRKILLRLEAEDPPVTITEGCDDICVRCPENKGGSCRSREKVSRMDRLCLRELRLSPGDSISWSLLEDRAYNNIILAGKQKEICRGCVWESLCIDPDRSFC